MRRIALVALAVVLAIATFPETGDAAASWTILPSPDASTFQNYLDAVSCTSRTACTAVGFSLPPSSDPALVPISTLAERWNGSTWSVQAAVNLGKSRELRGVACPSVTLCFAVGYWLNNAGTALPLLERWDGTTWSVPSFPQFWFGGGLGPISCSSATACTAVGSERTQSGQFIVIALRWDGTSWTTQAMAQAPSGAYDVTLNSVSCPATNACTAVGGYTNADSMSTKSALAEHWNGTTWSIQSLPTPPSTFFVPTSVSCPTTTYCTDTGGGTESWNGSTWSVQHVPFPAGALGGELSGVACPLATGCFLVGAYENASHVWVTRADRWDGTQWTVQTPANATTTNDNWLAAVSCPDPLWCVAVGYWDEAPSVTHTLIERHA